MDENEISEFSWSGLFIVTSICSFSFTGIMWLLDRNIPMLLLTVALSALGLAVLQWIGKTIQKVFSRKKNQEPDYVFWE